jgi:glycerophosphoryl diester phosphodiesterase
MRVDPGGVAGTRAGTRHRLVSRGRCGGLAPVCPVIADLLLDPGARPVIGHRGASAHAPENTLPAMELAVVRGAEALEFDVRLSADGVPVVCHDPTLDRTTDRAGPVAGLPWAALREADAGARFSPDGGASFPWRGRGIGIPRVEDVLGRFPTLPLLIELKTAEAALPLQRLLERHGAAGRAVVASFLDEAVRPFLAPPWLAGASRRAIAALAVRAALALPPRDRGFRLYAVPRRYKDRIPVPTRRFVRAARRLGAPVHVWTVDRPEQARALWTLGVSGIITNDPAAIRVARDGWERPGP